MTEQRDWVVAFAGDGDTTKENTYELLNNWITEDTGIKDFYVPEKIAKRTQKGLGTVVAYLTEEWQDFKTAPVGDLVDTLKSARDNEECDAFLVVIVGDGVTPDDVTADLIETALEEGITVLDLAAGLDEFTPDDPADNAEVPAPEPEKPAETTTRRRRATASTPEDKPAEAASEPPKPKRRGAPRTEVPAAREPEKKAADSDGDAPFDPPYRDMKTGVVTEAVERATKAGTEAAAKHIGKPASPLEDNAIRLIVREELRAVLAEVFGAALVSVGGAPTLPAPTIAFIKGIDGVVRKRGRGRPAKGEAVIFLTEAQAVAEGIEWGE